MCPRAVSVIVQQLVPASRPPRCLLLAKTLYQQAAYYSARSAATLIDGNAIAADLRREIKLGAQNLHKKYSQLPGLAVVLVGERKDSQTYVRNKKKAAKEVSQLRACMGQSRL